MLFYALVGVAQLYAAFLLIGLGSAMVLPLQAAFAVIFATCPARRDWATLAISMVAGLVR